jgi:16S rRNA (guanine966-N2)-methyltransferase
MRIISGKFRGRILYTPQDRFTRPTSDRTRESVFNILEHGFHVKWEGLHVLDLYAGTGALGIEALSRGAAFCLFIEHHVEAIKILKKNLSLFPLTALSTEDVRHLKSNSHPPFDVVFLDPPYGENLVPLTLKNLCSGHYLKNGSIISIELSSKEEIKIEKPFNILKEKIYGKTKIIFSQYKCSF